MMKSYVFHPPIPPTVAVAGEGGRFPVRRIFCVGRNYAAHAREMGKDPDRELPFFFTKPADAVVDSGATVPYPPETSDFHYEIELVVAIGREGFDVSREAALDLVFGYGVGVDLTRRICSWMRETRGVPGMRARRSTDRRLLRRCIVWTADGTQGPAASGSPSMVS
jgi:fumarylpyruvate hydrolase